MGGKAVDSLVFLLSYSKAKQSLVFDLISLRGVKPSYAEDILPPVLDTLYNAITVAPLGVAPPQTQGWTLMLPLTEPDQVDGEAYYRAVQAVREALPGIVGRIVASLTRTKLRAKADRPVSLKPYPQPGMVIPTQFEVTLTEDDRLAFTGEELVHLFSDQDDPLQTLND